MTDNVKLENIIDRIEYVQDEIEQLRKSKQLLLSEKWFLQEAITSLVNAQESIKAAMI